MSDKPLPLKGVRVLTMDQYGAAPYCTMIMADMGAPVIFWAMPT